MSSVMNNSARRSKCGNIFKLIERMPYSQMIGYLKTKLSKIACSTVLRLTAIKVPYNNILLCSTYRLSYSILLTHATSFKMLKELIIDKTCL